MGKIGCGNFEECLNIEEKHIVVTLKETDCIHVVDVRLELLEFFSFYCKLLSVGNPVIIV